jgi:cell division protein FtsW (lipid II flippase)
VVMTDHRRLQRYTWTTMLAGFTLLLLPLAPVIGREIRGATLWISIAGYSFQPAELAKIALTISFAGYLAVYGPVLASVRQRWMGLDLPRPRDLGPLLIAWLISLGILIFQRDLGTSLLFFGLFVVLLYVATQRRTWPVIGAVLFLSGSLLAWRLFSHVQTRVSLWLDPFQGDGTSQVALGLYGLAGGGIFGTGLGSGFPQIVPFAESDFIFATLGEELGIMGAVAILVMYAVIVQRGLRLAHVSRDGFSTLLAAGLSTVIGLQAFVVIGGVTRLIPLTGLTTPFLSYGGSSLVANWAIIGLLMRMSHAARKPAPTDGDRRRPASTASDDTQVIRR